MKSLVILEDMANRDGKNKSLRLAKLLSSIGYKVRLCDGKQIFRIQYKGDGEYEEFEKISLISSNQPGHATPESAATRVAEKIAKDDTVILILDLRFDRDHNYGFKFFSCLQSSEVFLGRIEPIVYSRWAGDDKREGLAAKFQIDGERVLQRDVDSDETVVEVVKRISAE